MSAELEKHFWEQPHNLDEQILSKILQFWARVRDTLDEVTFSCVIDRALQVLEEHIELAQDQKKEELAQRYRAHKERLQSLVKEAEGNSTRENIIASHLQRILAPRSRHFSDLKDTLMQRDIATPKIAA